MIKINQLEDASSFFVDPSCEVILPCPNCGYGLRQSALQFVGDLLERRRLTPTKKLVVVETAAVLTPLQRRYLGMSENDKLPARPLLPEDLFS